jgi:hypothetical protein
MESAWEAHLLQLKLDEIGHDAHDLSLACCRKLEL